MDKKIFKAYDIRGIYPKELNESTAFLIGQTCARKFKSGVFVVGFDTRLSSKKLLSSFLKGFRQESKKLNKKFNIKNVGLATTPMFYFSVNNLKASGGVMATASHNPAEYGGFKIVGPKATMISGKVIEKSII
jgi:phosphomannomutase